MKSSYELAMERLAKADPGSTRPLTAEKKKRLAEVDNVFKSKIAEREIFLKKQLEDALNQQQFDEVDKAKKQLYSERARLEEERDAEKETIRNGK